MKSSTTCLAFCAKIVLCCSLGYGQGLEADVFVDQGSIIWGYDTDITLVALGGTAPYSLLLQTQCSNELPPVSLACGGLPDPYSSITHNHKAQHPGEFTAYGDVCDSALDFDRDAEQFEVLKPDTISLEAATSATYIINLTQNGNTVSGMTPHIKFPVKKGATIVGPHAVGIGEENIKQLEPNPQKDWSGWQTGEYVFFESPNVVDIKHLTDYPLNLWNLIPIDTVTGRFLQRMRVRYTDCEGTEHILVDPKIYLVKWKKTGNMQITITFL